MDEISCSLAIIRNAFDLLCNLSKQKFQFPNLVVKENLSVLDSTARLVELDGNLFPLLFANEENVYTCKNEKLITPYVIVPITSEGELSEMNLDILKIVPAYQLAVADLLRKYVELKNANKKTEHIFARLNYLFGCQRSYFILLPVKNTEKKADKGDKEYEQHEEEKTGFKFKVFEPYEPLNELEANFLRKKVIYPREKVSETVRLPHESHCGRVDLFETPESEKIGLVFNMCEGSVYDPDNLTIKKGSNFSLSTLQIPFLTHSDGARILMGSKNLKQCIPLETMEEPILKTPHSLKIGINALVVYMLYKGLNFEDGVVVSESFAKRMFSRVKESKEISLRGVLPEEFFEQGNEIVFSWKASKPQTGALEKIESVLKFKKNVGEKVRKSDLLMVLETKVWVKDLGEFTFKKKEYRYEGYYEAKILSIKPSKTVMFPQKFESSMDFRQKMINSSESERESHLSEYLKGFETQFDVEFELELDKPFKIGDKITARHGNKGVISRILPDQDMPKVLIDGEWKTAEVLLSPLSVVSRMNLGQLFETQLTLLIKKGLHKDTYEITETIDGKKREKILEDLRSIGADDYGRFPVKFDDTQIHAVAGYQYVVRLDHCVGDKIHVIGLKAPTSPITFQPFKGRSRTGGQRFGEMEFWTLLDHNAFKTLNLFKECNKNLENEKVTSKMNEFLSRALCRLYKLSYRIEGDQVIFDMQDPKGCKLDNEEQEMFVRKMEFYRDKEELEKLRKKQLFQKEGYVRNVMIGRRLFNSARSTIVPCPELEPDEILLPAEFGRIFFKKPKATIEDLNAQATLKFVLVNRQPSLHKHNVQAFKLKFWNEWAIGFPILACKGYNADFDGDTVAVYYPTIQYEDELKKMTLKENPFIFGSGELALSIDQDIVYGMSLMGFRDKKESQNHFKKLILEGKWDEVMNLYEEALDLATKKNLTLSIFEIEKDAESFAKIKQTKCRGSKEQYDQLNGEIKYGPTELVGNFVNGVHLKHYLEYISERARKSLMDKKLHVAEAGDFTRFLVEAAGDVVLEEDKKEGVLEYPAKFIEKLIDCKLLSNALLWRYDVDLGRYLSEEDLEDIEKNPRKVRIFSPAVGSVTKKSFGLDPSTGKEIKTKYIGVVCAHSTGERGTQLSMQTFHTGGKGKGFQMSIVRSYIVKSAKTSKNFLEFLERLIEPMGEDAGKVVEMLDLRNKKKGIFENLSVQFSLIEVLYKPLKGFKKSVSLERGPLTCMSFEKGNNVIKKIQKLLKESKPVQYRETHPRAFFFDAFVL
ncbi:MAG TPA: hypothetical protein PLK95_09975 [Pseudothermotoga sp.]|nr:hypothetical protein [Pseudothermotoga sp.]HPP71036.1 hypothetical protein [Pseudothermotoga sp.]